LASSAEQLKKALSATMSRRHNVRFDGSVVQLEVTREQFEEITSELLERTMDITDQAITDARKKGVDHFDDVLLVGGMTIMPAVARTRRERFGLEPRLHDPNLAVAKGAALFALIKKLNVIMPDDGRSEAVREVAEQLNLTEEQVESLRNKKVATVVPRAF